MDALVMCGGRGTRLLADVEKPLYEIGGVPMVESVLDALAASCIEEVTCAVSPHTPATRAFLMNQSGAVLETPGEGYVADLTDALDSLDQPVLTVTADLPLLVGSLIDDVLARQPAGAATICVPTSLKRVLGTSVDRAIEDAGRRISPTGLNVVANAEQDTRVISYDARLAVNVNEPNDADIAEVLACG